MKKYIQIVALLAIGAITAMSFQNCGQSETAALGSAIDLEDGDLLSPENEDNNELWAPEEESQVGAAAVANSNIPEVTYFYIHSNTGVPENRLHLRFKCAIGTVAPYKGRNYKNYALYVNGRYRGKWTSGCRGQETRS